MARRSRRTRVVIWLVILVAALFVAAALLYDTMYRAGDVFMVTGALVTTQGFHLAHSVHPMWTQDLGISCLLQAGPSLQ